ncbi:hypothetical protein [Pseudomonas phage PJNP013]|uniref:Uncharacterized protein n=1 Tax=Pseudomonas phage PJNP013 TaxID=3108093 RepID=A0ABZ2CLP0_9CAUD
MAVKSHYFTVEPVLAALPLNGLTAGDLYRVVDPEVVEGTVVLAMRPAYPNAERRAVVIHARPDAAARNSTGALVTNSAWRFRRLQGGEYVQLTQAED